MQVTETLNKGLKRAYDILVTANELDENVQSKLRIKVNKYLVNCAETGIIWLLFLFALAIN